MNSILRVHIGSLSLVLVLIYSGYVQAQTKPQLEIQYGHYNTITALTTSNSGRFLLSGDQDGFIRIWEVKSGRIFKTISNVGGKIYDIVVHPSKYYYATLQRNRVVVRHYRGNIMSTVNYKYNINSLDFGADSLICLSTYRGIYIKHGFQDTTYFSLKEKRYNKKAYFLNDSTVLYSADDSVFTWDFKNDVVTSLDQINSLLKEKDRPVIQVNRSKNRISVQLNRSILCFDENFELLANYELEESNSGFILNHEMVGDSLCLIIPEADSLLFPMVYNIFTGTSKELHRNEEDLAWLPKVTWNKNFPNSFFCTAYNKKLEERSLTNAELEQNFEGLEINRKIYDVEYSEQVNKLFFKSYATHSILELDIEKGTSLKNNDGELFFIMKVEGDDYLLTMDSYNPEWIGVKKLQFDGNLVQAKFISPSEEFVIQKIFYFEKNNEVGILTENKNLYSLDYNREERTFSAKLVKSKLKEDESILDLNEEGELLIERYNKDTGLRSFFLKSYNSKKKLNPFFESTLYYNLLKFVPGSSDCIVLNNDSITRFSFIDDSYVVKWSTRITTGSLLRYTAIDFDSFGYFAAGTENGYIFIFDLETGKPVFKGKPVHDDMITNLKYIRQDSVILSAGHDGRFVFSSVGEKLNTLVTAVPFDAKEKMNGEYRRSMLYYTPDNYYFAQNVPENAFHFAYDYEIYSFDQFDALYNRPDIVMERLNGASFTSKLYNRAYRERMEKLHINAEENIDFKSIPQITLLNRKTLASKSMEKTVYVRARIDYDTIIESLNIWVNGVPYGLGTFNLREQFDSEIKKKGIDMTSFTVRKEIELSPGKNIIQISAEGMNGLSSLIETIEIEYIGPSEKPDLYFLGIGVKNYRDDRKDLQFSDKDVREALEAFSSSGDYANIYIDTLLNEKVLKENLLPFRDKIKEAKVDDVVIIYYSGHGILDDSLDYYLSTYDVDFNNPNKRGIPYDYLEYLMLNTPSRNKLVLLDACHSGELSDGVTIRRSKQDEEPFGSSKSNVLDMIVEKDEALAFELMKTLFVDIRRDNGSTVLASSGGAYFSFEDDEFTNGVFTYALKEGLMRSKADLNRDGMIMVSELKDYLISRVSNLTQGVQVPNARIENALIDFRVK